MTLAEIAEQARLLFDDPDADFVTSAEMTLHVQEVCQDFARRTRVMRKTDTLSITASGLTNGEVTLPSDCLEIIRIVDSNGRELPYLSSATLDEECGGSSWSSDTGTPRYYLRDMTGVDKIRLYPLPGDDLTLTVTYYQRHVVNTASSTINIPERYHVTLIWGAAARALSKSTAPADKPKIEQFGTYYESGVQQATMDAQRHWDDAVRSVPFY